MFDKFKTFNVYMLFGPKQLFNGKYTADAVVVNNCCPWNLVYVLNISKHALTVEHGCKR